jgi:hypothetical protein
MGEWWDYQKLVLGRACRQEWLRRDFVKWVGSVMLIPLVGYLLVSAWGGWTFSWPAFVLTVLGSLGVVVLMFVVTASREPPRIHREQVEAIQQATAGQSDWERLVSAADLIVSIINGIEIPPPSSSMSWLRPGGYSFHEELSRQQVQAVRLFRDGWVKGLIVKDLPLWESSGETEIYSWVRLCDYVPRAWPGHAPLLSDFGPVTLREGVPQLSSGNSARGFQAHIVISISVIEAVIRNGRATESPRPSVPSR